MKAERVAQLDLAGLMLGNKRGIQIAKRWMDVFFACVGIVLSLPVVMVFAILVKLESRGPAFYLQDRVGLNGKVFKMIKLRSMRCDAEKDGARWAEKNDPRLTRLGSFMRKKRIDELPQFINVLRGDMSLVGPRPERPEFTKKFDVEIPGFHQRLIVRPGITGWAQVHGGYDIQPNQKLEKDMFYIKEFSLWLDLKIILKTVAVVVTGHGAR